MTNVPIEQQSSRRLPRSWLDQAAVGISVMCLAQCLALPVAIAALPALSAALALPGWTHLALLLIALPLSFAGLIRGYRKHGRYLPIAIGAAGLQFMVIGVLFENVRLIETGLTVAGTTLVAVAHIRNLRLSLRFERGDSRSTMASA